MIDLKATVRAIREAMIRDMVHFRTLDVNSITDIKAAFIIGAGSSEDVIPFFSHPLVIDGTDHAQFLFTDIRPFVKKNEVEGLGFTDIPPVKNTTEFNFTKSRAILSLAWLSGHQSALRNDLAWAGVVYAMWLSEVIAKKYALDPKDQIVLAVLSYYFYYSLFSADEPDSDGVEKMAIHIIKATRAPAPLVFEILDKAGAIRDITEFCTAVIRVTENVRLQDFNVSMLLTIISNSWYGLNSREILAVALEHPPTWCAMVYMSLTERTFRNYMVSRIADRFGKHGNSDTFLKAYTGLVKEHTVQKTAGTESLEILAFE